VTMTTTVAATYPRIVRLGHTEPDALTLAGEHALLLQGVFRRACPVLALIDARSRPTAELNTLVAYLRTSLMRQTSDEEVLLFSGAAGTPFAELTAQHARLHGLTEGLAHANVAHCPLAELRRKVAELTNLLARHLATEHALLAGMGETSQPPPSVAELAKGGQPWRPVDDATLLIALDDLPSGHAAQLCIERLLRLRTGQRAEIRSSDRRSLEHVYRWMRAFDSANYRAEYAPAGDPSDIHLQVTRRRNS
jgi:hypothetical protein